MDVAVLLDFTMTFSAYISDSNYRIKFYSCINNAQNCINALVKSRQWFPRVGREIEPIKS